MNLITVVHQQSKNSLAVLKTQKDQEESKLALESIPNSQIDFEEIHNIDNKGPYFENLNDLSVKSTERKRSMKRSRKSTRRVSFYYLPPFLLLLNEQYLIVNYRREII